MKNLAAKMIKVLGAVSGKVVKSGKNTHQGYKYVMEADLLDAVRGELINHGIFVFSSVESVEQEASITTVRTKHTFVDAESGETFEVFSAGQGADKQDKGIYKAITGASKYFLLKSFLLAGDDDPESSVGAAAPTTKTTKTAPTASKKSGGFNKTPAAAKTPSGGFATKTTAEKVGFNKAVENAVQEEKPTGDAEADIPF